MKCSSTTIITGFPFSSAVSALRSVSPSCSSVRLTSALMLRLMACFSGKSYEEVNYLIPIEINRDLA
ncbi:hypothetical protein OPM30_004372 [Salmonella enterica]|nr:hypothetical protein [Salmonella enterica]EKB8098478.1 hypothetical protein [Salmonella enterica]EKE0307787.1 hypothetical protein [Salmonella enterica]